MFFKRKGTQNETQEAERETPPLKPKPLPRTYTLYFAGDGLDEQQMRHCKATAPYRVIEVDGREQAISQSQKYPVVEAIKVGEQSFVVRQLDRHTLFRDLHSPAEEDALFLWNTTLEGFAETYPHRTPGRCIMYVPRCMNEGDCIYLFFERNGTGFALLPNVNRDTNWVSRVIKHERVDFQWDDLTDAPDEIFEVPVAKMRLLCETLFELRINPHLHEPYLYREKMQGIPLSWESGSEEEFRWLARAICLTEPDMFNGQEPVTLVYRTTTPYKRGGFRYVERKELQGAYSVDGRFTSRRLMSLCDLAFRLNPCIGMEWIDCPEARGNIRKSAIRIQITVTPPSAHEKAEAYLTLMDWLDDKLYDTEKRARFGLPSRSTKDESTGIKGDIV